MDARRALSALACVATLALANLAQGQDVRIDSGSSSSATGDVVGPSSSTDNWLVRFDATTGKLVQGSGVTLSDAGANAFTADSPAQAASSVAGNPIALVASPAVAGASNAGAAAGASVTLTAGAAARNASGNANAGNVVITESAGIGTGHATQLITPVGVDTAPGIAFTGDTNTGFDDLIAFHYVYGISNGTQHLRFGGSAVQLLGPTSVLSSVGGAAPGILQWIPSVEVVTTTKAPSVLEAPEIYTNTGDTDGQAITLPNDPAIGVCFDFYLSATDASGNFSVAPNTGETIQAAGSSCATSYTATAKGNSARICAVTGGSGAIWGVMSHEGTWTCT